MFYGKRNAFQARSLNDHLMNKKAKEEAEERQAHPWQQC